MGEALPDIPYAPWRATKDTLHLWLQVVGKVKLALTSPRNHWWNVPLYVDARGLTTRRIPHAGGSLRIDLDLIEHALRVETSDGGREGFLLRDGLSVAGFHDALMAALGRVGLRVEIDERPFGVPMTTPFPRDAEHASYDPDAVWRFWRALDRVDGVFEEFAGWSSAKTSPVHLFWHSFDLAVTRFSGRPAPPVPEADPVTREAYSHEAISFGFWAGDERVPMPAFYSYTAPEPAGLTRQPLRPAEAAWNATPTGSMALLPYDAVRRAPNPRRALLDFLQSAYDAGARTAGWDRGALVTRWCPPEARPAGGDEEGEGYPDLDPRPAEDAVREAEETPGMG
jgi:hypothetical protein